MIWILSEPIRSGKTSYLKTNLQNSSNVLGFLTPDLDGKRVLQFLPSNEIFPFEVTEFEEESISIGRFNFLNKSFDKAADYIMRGLAATPKIVVIDELGKLELRRKGFYNLIRELVHQSRSMDFILILVIRDTIIDQAISAFALQSAKILTKTQLDIELEKYRLSPGEERLT